MTSTPFLTVDKAVKQTELLRQQYRDLVQAAAPENTPTELAELSASNNELRARVEQFRKDLEASLVKLPNGAIILSGECECLLTLARVNGVKEEALRHFLLVKDQKNGG